MQVVTCIKCNMQNAIIDGECADCIAEGTENIFTEDDLVSVNKIAEYANMYVTLNRERTAS